MFNRGLIMFFISFGIIDSSIYLQERTTNPLAEANAFVEQGKIKDAITIWKQLIVEESEPIPTDSMRMICYMKLAQSYLLDYNDFDTTRIYLDLLEQHCKTSQMDRCFVFKYSLESLFYEFQNDFISAIESGKKGIAYVNKGGNDDLWYTTHSNYGYNFHQIGELERAREQYLLASKSRVLSDHDNLEFTINVSSTFENNPDSVLFYSQPAMSVCDTLSDIWLCPYIVNNVAFSLASLGRFEEAEKIVDQENVINTYLLDGDTQAISYLNNTIGHIKLNLNKLEDAESYLLASLEQAKELGSNITIRSNLKDLSLLYEKMKDYDKSLSFLKEESEVSELVHTEKIQKELANYENAKILKEKDSQIGSLVVENESISDSLQKMIMLALSLLLLTLLGIIFWLYRNQKTKIKFHSLNNEISLAKLQSLQVSMNPHFLFNTFSTLQLFILENKSKKALDYLGSLSNLLRRILYNSKDVVVKLNEEIDLLESYFFLEAERFDHEIKLNVMVEEELKQKNPSVPAMILQPHLENAILHGISNSDRRGVIDFELKDIDNSLFCSITDNGVGREISATKKGNRQHLSTASKNTSSRLEILKKLGYTTSDMNVIDLKNNDGKALGTRVEIILPFIE